MSFGDELSFEVGEESESLLELLEGGILGVGRLEKAFFVVFLNERNNSVGFFNFLVDVLVLVGYCQIIVLC